MSDITKELDNGEVESWIKLGLLKGNGDLAISSQKKYKQRAESDAGLMFTAYNLRRMINLLNKNQLKNYLIALAQMFLMIMDSILLQIKLFKPSVFFTKKSSLYINLSLKSLIFGQMFGFSVGFLDELTLCCI